MAKVTKKVQAQDVEPTDEEVAAAEEEIEELQRQAQQLRDLRQAAATGDHKLVFNKLGVKVSPQVPQQQPQQQPQQPQQTQQQPALEATPQGMQGNQLEDGQWQQINSAFSQQAKQINQLTQLLQKSTQEIGILRAEQQQTQLKNAMGLEIERLMADGEMPFLEGVDKAEVLDGVIRKLEAFKNTYGYETTIAQVLSEMDKSYEKVFVKFSDKYADEGDDDEQEQEGQEAAGEGAEEEPKEGEVAPQGDEQDYEFTEDDTQDGGEGKVKILDPQDEDAKDRLVDGLLEKHMKATAGRGSDNAPLNVQ